MFFENIGKLLKSPADCIVIELRWSLHMISNFKFIGQIEVEMISSEILMARQKGKQA